MALSKKIPDSGQKKPSVEDLILKGGSSGNITTEQLSDGDAKKVQLRIPLSLLDQVDSLVQRRPGKLSRHTWIMEAIEEKLKKDITL